MAQVKYGAIVTELKGKVQGQVFQGGNNGFILRNKGYTKGVPSARRSAATQNLVAMTTLWKTLTNAQRTAWATAALGWAFTDRFGNTYFGSGFQVFVAYNTVLVNQGNDVVLTPIAAARPDNPGAITLGSTGAGVLTLTYAIPDTSGSTMAIYVSKSLSAGLNGNNVAKLLTSYFDYSAGTPINLVPHLPNGAASVVSGAKIFVKTTNQRQDYPYSYYPQFAQIIIP